jgi:prepilin-type N-terminal cleavage/methylation domain-containing protein
MRIVGAMRASTARPRAFSLIEVMIAVALIGILAAIAGPRLLPEVHKAQLDAAGESVAAFVARARTEAMLSKRCVRVYIVAPRTFVAERLNKFDCDDNPLTAPEIQSGAGTWIKFATMTLDSAAVTPTWATIPTATNNAAGPGDSGAGAPSPAALGNHFLRFRPSGRVYGNNLTYTDDDAELLFTHARLSAVGNQNQKRLLVKGNGLTCLSKRGVSFTASACPASSAS